MMPQEPQELPYGPLKLEIAQLQHAVVHLLRSNEQLRQAIAERGPDRDYQDAINENIVTIARHKARIASIKEQLHAMGAEVPVASRGTWL